MGQGQVVAPPAAEAPVGTGRVHPPIYIETIGRQPLVQCVAHFPIKITQISIANPSQACDIKQGIPAKQRIKRPRNTIDTLMANHLPLRSLERKTQPQVSIFVYYPEHARIMLQSRAIRRAVISRETENETNQLLFDEST